MTILTEFFGNNSRTKVLETFVENYESKLFVADIVRMTDLSMLVVRYQVKKLLELGLIEKKDRLGHTQYYQLNMNNQNAKIILLLERNVISERLDRVCEDLMF